jgi:hypothetical protein
MKLRNILPVGLLISQCGCGHTYFAWSKPLPVEQTEVSPFPAPGLLDSARFPFASGDFGNSDDRRDIRKAAERNLGEAMRTRAPFPKH